MNEDTKPRTSDQDHTLQKEEFLERFREIFSDPYYRKDEGPLLNLQELAWRAYEEGRKAPYRRKAGIGFTDPEYELSQDWIKASEAIKSAQLEHDDPQGPARVLLICASNRNDQTCPGEISKTSRLYEKAVEIFKKQGILTELLDLSRITSEYGKMIHPCKGCVSTAMPLCHWPCSCYPHHSLGQVHDWMNEIYPMWVRAHGVMIITPVYWHQVPSGLKLMMDRLVCADGGNPDPTSTQGKKAELAKKMELDGWDYPRHLKGRFYSVVVQADAIGIDEVSNALSSWLDDMQLIPAGNRRILARYIGYLRPYATGHLDLDEDEDIFIEVEESARALAICVRDKKQGILKALDFNLKDPRPK